MLYILIFNKPFLANFASSKNVYSCLNACTSLSICHRNVHGIYQNLSWILLNANKHILVHAIALLVLIFQQFK